MIHARRGDYEEADRLISVCLQQMRGSWEPLHVAQALLSLASVRHAPGALGEAREMIAEARALIDACHGPGILRERLQQAARALVPAYRRADQDTGVGLPGDRPQLPLHPSAHATAEAGLSPGSVPAGGVVAAGGGRPPATAAGQGSAASPRRSRRG
jgi:hypothetical protein